MDNSKEEGVIDFAGLFSFGESIGAKIFKIGPDFIIEHDPKPPKNESFEGGPEQDTIFNPKPDHVLVPGMFMTKDMTKEMAKDPKKLAEFETFLERLQESALVMSMPLDAQVQMAPMMQVANVPQAVHQYFTSSFDYETTRAAGVATMAMIPAPENDAVYVIASPNRGPSIMQTLMSFLPNQTRWGVSTGPSGEHSIVGSSIKGSKVTAAPLVHMSPSAAPLMAPAPNGMSWTKMPSKRLMEGYMEDMAKNNLLVQQWKSVAPYEGFYNWKFDNSLAYQRGENPRFTQGKAF